MSSNDSFLDAGPVKLTELEGGQVLYEFDADQHAACLLRQLYLAQSTDSSTCDVTLCTKDGYEVPFHAVVLAASSSVFRRQVAGDLYDVTDIKITVPVELEVVQVIRDSMYTSKVTITPENARKVKEAAKRYELKSLYQVCLQYEQGKESEEEEDEEDGDDEDDDDYEEAVDDEVEAEGKSYQAKILSKLRYLFNKEKLTTVTLQDENGDGNIRCHGALLAATSPKFQKMLSFKSSDARTAKFRLKKVTEDAIRDILHFVYTAKVAIGGDNVEGLLRAACPYQLPGIAKACCDWFSNNLDADNVLGIRFFGREMRSSYCDQLLSDAEKFIQANFEDVRETEEFDDLSLEELIEIINDDNLEVDSEENVVYAVIKWVKFDKEQRLHELPTLLQYTRLEHTSLEFLETLCQDPDIEEICLCREIIQKVMESFQAKSVCRTESPIPYTNWDHCFDTVNEGAQPYQQIYPPIPDDFYCEAPFNEGGEPFQEIPPPAPHSFQDEPIPCRPRRRLRKDGLPDMRYKENRDELLEKGRNKNGTLDKRTKECKQILKETPKRKDGQPDMRFKVNRDLLLEKGKKKDGSQDMRCRPNKDPPRSQMSPMAPFRSPGGPLKKDGTPDMRFKVNRKLFSDSDSAGSPSSRTAHPHRALAGPLKKDGTPDMRFAVNKQIINTSQFQHSSRGRVPSAGPSLDRSTRPLKKDGTPDMRYAANKQAHSTLQHHSSSTGSVGSASLSSARSIGPLKRDGTPDMRYAVNRASSGSSVSLGSGASSNSGISSRSSYVTPSCAPTGPFKRDGTPDMRYAANKTCYGSSSSVASGSSSRSSSYRSTVSSYGSSSFRPSGPLTKSGAPDMRFKANRLR